MRAATVSGPHPMAHASQSGVCSDQCANEREEATTPEDGEFQTRRFLVGGDSQSGQRANQRRDRCANCGTPDRWSPVGRIRPQDGASGSAECSDREDECIVVRHCAANDRSRDRACGYPAFVATNCARYRPPSALPTTAPTGIRMTATYATA